LGEKTKMRGITLSWPLPSRERNSGNRFMRKTQ
jgi:hypothetical protein